MIGAVQAPAYGEVQIPVATVTAPAAALSYEDGKVIITGSVEHLFNSGEFIGPNRVLKQDRARINVDALALTKSFEQTRMRLAAAQAEAVAKAQGPDAPKSGALSPTITVASLDPAAESAALRAIDASVPMPAAPSGQLSYARENAPVTDFSAQAASKYSERELWCLSQAIYFESRGESYRGQVAVAQVVMNRLKHRLYPNTICGVVFQGEEKRNACQFSFACDGIPETVTDKKSWAQAEEIAQKVTSGELYLPEVANATHYHATYVYPDWAPRLHKITKIGLHVFYRFKGSAAG